MLGFVFLFCFFCLFVLGFFFVSLRSHPVSLLCVKTLQETVLLSNVRLLLTINDNGLHDSDGAEIQKLYKSKSNESPACARTD